MYFNMLLRLLVNFPWHRIMGHPAKQCIVEYLFPQRKQLSELILLLCFKLFCIGRVWIRELVRNFKCPSSYLKWKISIPSCFFSHSANLENCPSFTRLLRSSKKLLFDSFLYDFSPFSSFQEEDFSSCIGTRLSSHWPLRNLWLNYYLDLWWVDIHDISNLLSLHK